MGNTMYEKALDSTIEQAERSARIFLAMLRDVQAVYVSGAGMILKAGLALGKRSRVSAPFVDGAASLFEDVAPAITKAQYDLANASINASLDALRSIRDNLADRTSTMGGNRGSQQDSGNSTER
jgi:hypothetical protein